MNIFKQIYAIFLVSLLSVSANAQNRIILLNGTSSCGKSSIVRELLPLLSGPTEVISFDQTFYEIAKKKISDERGGNVVISDADLEAYAESLDPQVYKDLCGKIEEQVGPTMYSTVRKLYLEGMNVIIDTVMFGQEGIESLHDLPVCMILVYCPLEPLLQHLLQRNQSTDKKEHRSIATPFSQFFEMYKKREITSETSIDVLKKTQVDWILSEMKRIVQETEKSPDESAKFIQAVEERAPKIYEEFELNKYEEIEITPTVYHDLVVNTGTLCPREAAQQIAGFVTSKAPCTALQQNYAQLNS